MVVASISDAPRMPRPPALLTAATSSGDVTPDIPARAIGCSISSSSVKAVLITRALSNVGATGAGCYLVTSPIAHGVRESLATSARVPSNVPESRDSRQGLVGPVVEARDEPEAALIAELERAALDVEVRRDYFVAGTIVTGYSTADSGFGLESSTRTELDVSVHLHLLPAGVVNDLNFSRFH